MNLLSFSLYGTKKMYVDGMLANIPLAKKHYPGWRVFVYVPKGHPATHDLIVAGAMVFDMPEPEGHMGMFWRFLSYDIMELDYVVFRDADSRIGAKEAAAVTAWMDQGTDSHIMRDHQDHTGWPILGGMFGLRTTFLPNMRNSINLWLESHAGTEKLDDMRYLAEVIWPQIKTHPITQHSSVPSKFGGDPFPPFDKSPGEPDYVGQIFPATKAKGVKKKCKSQKRARSSKTPC